MASQPRAVQALASTHMIFSCSSIGGFQDVEDSNVSGFTRGAGKETPGSTGDDINRMWHLGDDHVEYFCRHDGDGIVLAWLGDCFGHGGDRLF